MTPSSMPLRLGWNRRAVVWCVAAPVLVLLPELWRALMPGGWSGYEAVGRTLTVVVPFGLAALLRHSLGTGQASTSHRFRGNGATDTG